MFKATPSFKHTALYRSWWRVASLTASCLFPVTHRCILRHQRLFIHPHFLPFQLLSLVGFFFNLDNNVNSQTPDRQTGNEINKSWHEEDGGVTAFPLLPFWLTVQVGVLTERTELDCSVSASRCRDHTQINEEAASSPSTLCLHLCKQLNVLPYDRTTEQLQRASFIFSTSKSRRVLSWRLS